MDKYENLGTIGEGTYGVVLKCRHKETGQIVAIKKFKESDEDEQVRKTALREIRILKQLKHENIVNLIEVFRRKGKLYLVFEFVEKTILEEIELHPEGLPPAKVRLLMWQLIRAIQFCHKNNIIHRDIKPENLLVSKNGVLKLCDFGFARPLASVGAKCTEYVSTRWYRAPELLVGDVSYGKSVDVWAIGCMFAEITNGLPLFPGDSDIDQLYHIIKCIGGITNRQKELFKKNPLYIGVKLPGVTEEEPIDRCFPELDPCAIHFMKEMLHDEPLDRLTCDELLNHKYMADSIPEFELELKKAIANDESENVIRRKKVKKLYRVEQKKNVEPITCSIESLSSRNEVSINNSNEEHANFDRNLCLKSSIISPNGHEYGSNNSEHYLPNLQTMSQKPADNFNSISDSWKDSNNRKYQRNNEAIPSISTNRYNPHELMTDNRVYSFNMDENALNLCPPRILNTSQGLRNHHSKTLSKKCVVHPTSKLAQDKKNRFKSYNLSVGGNMSNASPKKVMKSSYLSPKSSKKVQSKNVNRIKAQSFHFPAPPRTAVSISGHSRLRR